MPGSGKSVLSSYLQKNSYLDLIELDKYIEETHNKTLFELIEKHGESGFKTEIEEKALMSIIFDKIPGKRPMVISPGGSIIYNQTGMEFLKKPGNNNLIIYLDVAFDKLKERTKNFTNRGIVFNGLTPEELHKERDVLYRKYADIIIKPEDLNVEQLGLLCQVFVKTKDEITD